MWESHIEKKNIGDFFMPWNKFNKKPVVSSKFSPSNLKINIILKFQVSIFKNYVFSVRGQINLPPTLDKLAKKIMLYRVKKCHSFSISAQGAEHTRRWKIDLFLFFNLAYCTIFSQISKLWHTLNFYHLIAVLKLSRYIIKVDCRWYQ